MKTGNLAKIEVDPRELEQLQPGTVLMWGALNNENIYCLILHEPVRDVFCWRSRCLVLTPRVVEQNWCFVPFSRWGTKILIHGDEHGD